MELVDVKFRTSKRAIISSYTRNEAVEHLAAGHCVARVYLDSKKGLEKHKEGKSNPSQITKDISG